MTYLMTYVTNDGGHFFQHIEAETIDDAIKQAHDHMTENDGDYSFPCDMYIAIGYLKNPQEKEK